MSQFKIGDRVKINSRASSYINERGVIVRLMGNIRAEVNLDNGKTRFYSLYKLNLENLTKTETVTPMDSLFINGQKIPWSQPIYGNSEAIHIETRQPVTMTEAFIQDFENSKPKYIGQALTWYKQGKCPKCGELGRYHLSTPICSQHGTY